MNLQPITLDSGMTIETTPQGAQAIQPLQDTISGCASASEGRPPPTQALAAKDTELAAKDAEIADLKAKVLDAAALDKLVADRASLVAQATKLVDKLRRGGQGRRRQSSAKWSRPSAATRR
jgi:hypothetical protein